MASISALNYALTLVTLLGCGTIAGVFFAFSTFVMKALGRLPPEEGIAAMQSINVFAINSWFLVAFLGTAGFCVATMIAAVFQLERAVRHFPDTWPRALPGRVLRRDHVLQCANERGSGGAPTNRPRPSRSLGQLPERLDDLEPRPHRRLSPGNRVAGNRSEQNCLNADSVTTTVSL